MITFDKISGLKPGAIFNLLKESYKGADKSLIDESCSSWKEFDDFLRDNPGIADSTGFVSKYGNVVIGFASWDTRPLPGFIEIGHNCILPGYRNNRYGRMQVEEIIRRTRGLTKIMRVTTGAGIFFEPALRMYRSAGFVETGRERDNILPGFTKVKMELLLR